MLREIVVRLLALIFSIGVGGYIVERIRYWFTGRR